MFNDKNFKPHQFSLTRHSMNADTVGCTDDNGNQSQKICLRKEIIADDKLISQLTFTLPN